MQQELRITQEEYADRRRLLLEKMPFLSIAILPAGIQKFRNADTEYPFRQESNFYYLCGFCEPNALLVLIKAKNGAGEFILFCEPNQPDIAVWVGSRIGPEGAMQQFGAHRAYAFDELDSIMPILLENKQQVLYSLGHDVAWDARMMKWLNLVRAKVRSGVHAPMAWLDLVTLVREQRLIKSPAEINLMRKAAEISAHAHIALMQICKPNKWEYELEGVFLQECYQKGCRGIAYSPIVGGGENACILHYTKNNQILKSGDLVLIDAGGEYQYYAADITRTFPVNGQFTKDQQAIYELVLQAQLAAIELVKPGTRWDKLQQTIISILVQGLITLGILKGEAEVLIEQKAYKKILYA